jgi:hypothetical protein
METIEKIDIKKIKKDIKAKAELQKWYKNQRKTVHKNCERKPGDPEDIQPWVATMKHSQNREELRVLYALYGKLRGKPFSYVENKYPEEDHPLKQYQLAINRLYESYIIKEKIEESGD